MGKDIYSSCMDIQEIIIDLLPLAVLKEFSQTNDYFEKISWRSRTKISKVSMPLTRMRVYRCTRLSARDIRRRNQVRKMCFLFKIIKTQSPQHFYQHLSFSRSKRDPLRIQLREDNSQIVLAAFTELDIRFWNNLPPELRMLERIADFNKKVFSHFSLNSD